MNTAEIIISKIKSNSRYKILQLLRKGKGEAIESFQDESHCQIISLYITGNFRRAISARSRIFFFVGFNQCGIINLTTIYLFDCWKQLPNKPWGDAHKEERRREGVCFRSKGKRNLVIFFEKDGSVDTSKAR